MFTKLLHTDEVTSSYNLKQDVCTIAQSVYNTELVGADSGNTGRFGHILLERSELKGTVMVVANVDKEKKQDFRM